MKTTFIAFLSLSSAALAGTPLSFQQLPENDSIQVTFTSTGCFSRRTYEFDFRRKENVTVKVTRIEDRWSEAKKCREELKRVPLGAITLSETEIAGLDRLLEFYRAKTFGGCTTVDEIIVTQKSGDIVQAKESFTDKTCATYDMKNLTLLPAIVEKLEHKSE